MFTMKLRSVGNPDFGQYAPVSEPKVVRAATLAELRTLAEGYQKEWDLGGGNWVSPVVRDGTGRVVGHFSWNLRFWEGDGSGDWRNEKEILIDETAPAAAAPASHDAEWAALEAAVAEGYASREYREWVASRGLSESLLSDPQGRAARVVADWRKGFERGSRYDILTHNEFSERAVRRLFGFTKTKAWREAWYPKPVEVRR